MIDWFDRLAKPFPRAVRNLLTAFIVGASIGAGAISGLLIPRKNDLIELQRERIQQLESELARRPSGDTTGAMAPRESEIVQYFIWRADQYEQEVQRLRTEIEVIRLGRRDTSRFYRWIRGRVADRSGAPVADALVEIGSSHVLSLSNGEFYIPASRGASVVLSKPGFKTLTVTEWGEDSTQHLVLVSSDLE